jgi:DNA polymerase-3 subunit chi
MAEIGFYHLTRSTLVQTLPALLGRTLAAGQRALVINPKPDALSSALWAQPDWLPHGTEADGDPDLQPIWLSADPHPANGAKYLFLTEGTDADGLEAFLRVFDLFDGNDPAAVEAARQRWKRHKAGGHSLAYWQQTERRWEKKAG